MIHNKYFIITILINITLGNFLFSRIYLRHEYDFFEIYSYFVHTVVAICFLYLLFKIAEKSKSRFKSIYFSFIFSYMIPVISINIILLTHGIKANNFEYLSLFSAFSFIVGLFVVSGFWVPFGVINAYFVTVFIKSISSANPRVNTD